jgi:hypothetical protein
MHHKRLSNSDWKDVLDKFQKRLSRWKNKLLSVGGRLTLLNSVLSSLLTLCFHSLRSQKRCLKNETFRSQFFFWQNEGQKKKYHLTKWDVLCTPKDHGGMGILNLKYQNDCLLSK